MMTHHDDRLVMEEYNELVYEPRVWANDDVIVMMYYVFESLVDRR